MPLSKNHEQYRNLDGNQKKHTDYFFSNHYTRNSYPALRSAPKKIINQASISSFFGQIRKRQHESSSGEESCDDPEQSEGVTDIDQEGNAIPDEDHEDDATLNELIGTGDRTEGNFLGTGDASIAGSEGNSLDISRDSHDSGGKNVEDPDLEVNLIADDSNGSVNREPSRVLEPEPSKVVDVDKLVDSMASKMTRVMGLSEDKSLSNLVYDSVMDALQDHNSPKNSQRKRSVG